MSIVIYVLVAAGLFAFNVFDNTYAPFVLDVAFAVITVIDLAVCVTLRFGVTVKISEDSQNPQKGEELRFVFIAENKTVFPVLRGNASIAVKITGNEKNTRDGKIKKKITFSCEPRKSRTFELEVRPVHCENVTIKLKRYTARDFLHIFGISRKSGETLSVAIMPEKADSNIRENISKVFLSGDDEIYSGSKPGNDVTEFYGIRKYENGDSQRSINWKLTSKLGELIVRDFGFPVKDRDCIIIDIFKENCSRKERIQRIDEMYRLLLCMVEVMMSRKAGFNAVYYNGEYNNARIETQDDIIALFSQLYSIVPYENEVSAASYFGLCEENEISGKIIYVTPLYDKSTENNLDILSGIGKTYYLIPGHTQGAYLPVEYKGSEG